MEIGKIENKGGVVNLGTIYGDVSTVINQMPSASNAEFEWKEIITQLQNSIFTEPDLNEEDKAEALKQVKIIAEAGQSPDESSSKNMAKSAIRMLKGIVAELPNSVKLADACSRLLPIISSLF